MQIRDNTAPSAMSCQSLQGDDDLLSLTWFCMAALCEMRVPNNPDAKRAAQSAVDEVKRIEAKFSRYREDSLTTAINRAAGISQVACDSETIALLDFASRMFAVSDGLLDLSSGVLRKVWNFRGNAAEPAMPALQASIEKTLPLIGWEKIEISETSIFLPIRGMEIDFGGIGKEYAADRARQLLVKQGVQSALIDLGGDIATLGSKPDGSPWNLGIRDPRAENKLLATLSLHTGALATSGDYERVIHFQGGRFCHILNPKTGWPCNHWQSVSVAHSSCLLSGALATIAMLMEQDALNFLKRNDAKWFCVGPNGDIVRS